MMNGIEAEENWVRILRYDAEQPTRVVTSRCTNMTL